MDPYEVRAKEYNFASFQDVKNALQSPDTVILDTRTPDEIRAAGTLPNAIQTTCTATACPDLSAAPQNFVPNNKSTVVIFCRSGRRAATAKRILQEKGHTGTILNAGGWDDVQAALSS
jgi:phage shock protein E